MKKQAIKQFFVAFHIIYEPDRKHKFSFHIVEAKNAKEALKKFWESDVAYKIRACEGLTLRAEVYPALSIYQKKGRPAAKHVRKGMEINWQRSIESGSAIFIQ